MDELHTGGAVFTSCITAITVGGSDLIFSGSHDSHVYCWERGCGLDRYALKWKTRLDSEIYGTVSLANQIEGNASHALLCVCTTIGRIHLIQPYDGQILTNHALPGQIFSSPAHLYNFMTVGCRDNYIYCLSIKHHQT